MRLGPGPVERSCCFALEGQAPAAGAPNLVQEDPHPSHCLHWSTPGARECGSTCLGSESLAITGFLPRTSWGQTPTHSLACSFQGSQPPQGPAAHSQSQAEGGGNIEVTTNGIKSLAEQGLLQCHLESNLQMRETEAHLQRLTEPFSWAPSQWALKLDAP